MRYPALVFGLSQGRVARLGVSSRGAGEFLFTKTRGDPLKNGLIPKRGL